jgi:predicted enzyme related to lactoylglutathione lyase
MTEFCRFDLRTTDADAARAFYTSVLGHDRAAIWPLHEQALARGARPHWLGHLGVEDFERAAAAFVERGAMPLGPTRPTADGGQAAVLRDPGGALVSVGTPPPANVKTGIEAVWHVLNTSDVARAAANYHDLFGWEVSDRLERIADVAFHQFAWHPGGVNVGAFADIAARPGVHAHWLFFFEVDALDQAIAAARAGGGLVLDPVVAPSGQRVCVCDDPQGAAFGLRERAVESVLTLP